MGILIGAALIGVAALAVAGSVVTGGAAALVLIGAALVAGGTILSMGGKGFLQGAKQGQQHVEKHGQVKTGSASVTINKRAAAAACLSQIECDQHSGSQKMAQGSRTVTINGKMASRMGDKSTCDGVIGAGSDNVTIGGAMGQCAAISQEVASWETGLAKGAIVAGMVLQIVGTIVSGVGAYRLITLAPEALRAAMMVRMGASLATGLVFGSGASYYGGQKYGQGSWQQEVLGAGAGLFGGVLGDAAASSGPRIIGGIKSGFEGAFEPGGLFGGPELVPAGGPGGFGSGVDPEIVPRAPGSPGMDAWNPPKNDPMQMTGTGEGGGSGAAGTPKTPQEISQANYDRAAQAKLDLPKRLDPSPRIKTVASAGGKDYLSGWEGDKPRNLPDSYDSVSPEDVKAHSDKIGHTLAKGSAPDQIDNGGFEGKSNASHAEKQALLGSGGESTGVSKDMCGDCQNFFKQDAIYNNRTNYNTDPNGQWKFEPDGTITRPDGEIVSPGDKIDQYIYGKVDRQDGTVLPAIPRSGK